MAITPNNPNTHPPQVPPPGYYSSAEDEISLIELWNVLAGRWRLIAATTLLATLIAIVYALTAPPLYRATAYFLPPSKKDMAPFNETGIQVQSVQDVQDVQGVTVDEAYSLFKRTLSSKSLLHRYKSEQRSLEGTPSLIINSDNKIPGSLNLSIEWHDPDEAADWANGLSEMANKLVVEQLLSNIDYRLRQQIENVEYTISSKRKFAKKRREDRIVMLEEALHTAEALELKERFNTNPILYEDSSQAGDIAINTVNTPTYYRGTRALLAEIDILRNRTSDDPFITILRDLEEELIHRKSINISDISIKAYTLDQSATSPKQPIKPKRRLIVTLGGIIGLMGGVFLAFLLNFIQNQKNRSEEG